MVVEVTATTDPASSLTIKPRSDPQLAVSENLPAMNDLLLDFQIMYPLRKDIWSILEKTQLATMKSARLLSLELEEEILGPFAGLFLADSRHV